MNYIQIKGTIRSLRMNETTAGKVVNMLLMDTYPAGRPTFKIAFWQKEADRVENFTKGDTIVVTGSISKIDKNEKGDLIEIPNGHLVPDDKAIINYLTRIPCSDDEEF